MPEAALLRDGPRRREAPGRRASARTPARPSGRGSSRLPARHESRNGCSSPTCSPAGASGRSPSGQPGYNPVGYHTGSIWPHDNALIAAGLKASGADRRREPPRRPAHRGRPVVPGPAPARAVLRVPPGRRRGAGGLSGRLLAAGMGRRRAVLPAPHDARAARRRDRPIASSSSARTCPTGSARSPSPACRSARIRSTCWSTAGAAGRAPSSSAGAARSTSSSTSERGRPQMTDPPSTTGTIVVSGTGRVAVDPDVAELRLGVAVSRPTRGRRARRGGRGDDRHPRRGRGGRRRADATSGRRSSSVQPRYDYRDGKAPTLVGYDLANIVEVTVARPGQPGRHRRRLAVGRRDQPRWPVVPRRRPARGRARGADRGRGRGAIPGGGPRRGGRRRHRRRGRHRRGRAAADVAAAEGGADAPRPADAGTPVEAGTTEISVTVTVTFRIA